MILAFRNTGESTVVSASCTSDDFPRQVVTRAKAAAGNVNCTGNVCIHSRDDDTRVVFAFREDGSLAGVIDNADTSDADGTDGEVAALMDAIDRDCPKTDQQMADELYSKQH